MVLKGMERRGMMTLRGVVDSSLGKDVKEKNDN